MTLKFDFQQNEVSFFFFLSHLSALSCIFAGDYVELKLPWQLLNFSDPSRMTIHDDYYENYGVDYITIDTMYLGLTDGAAQERTPLYPAALKGWGNTVSYHERLKPSYYILQKLWQ